MASGFPMNSELGTQNLLTVANRAMVSLVPSRVKAHGG